MILKKTAGLTRLFDGIYNRWFEESLLRDAILVMSSL